MLVVGDDNTMWQVLLAAAAAIAGSGIFAKRLLNINGAQPIAVSPKSDEPKQVECCLSLNSSPPTCTNEESIFRFSSASGFPGSKKWRKKPAFGSRGFKNVEKSGERTEEDRRTRFAVCLKKRRTTKNATAKCQSCASKDNPSFGWGVGVGIMYMMSAGKAEISRLNMVMDQTVEVVQELKAEIHKRKSSRDLHVSSFNAEAIMNSKKIRGKHTPPAVSRSSTKTKVDTDVYASSVLTEEPQSEVLEMDQLEAELENEFQNLPLCATDIYGHDKGIPDILKTDVLAEPEGQRYNGVTPSELDQKLCHLLMEQQESQIMELESELQWTHSKLHEKEAQLQALKGCVKRLTDFSLATASDEETEAQVQEEKTSDKTENKMGPEPENSVVGIQRAMFF